MFPSDRGRLYLNDKKQALRLVDTEPVRFPSCLGEMVFLPVAPQVLAEGAAGLHLLQIGVAAGAAGASPQ